MKKVITLIMALVMLCTVLTACSGDKKAPEGNTDIAAETEAAPVDKSSTDHIKIDGMFVDSSYVVEEGSSLQLLYVFYTLTATDTNLEIDSKYTYFTIGQNKYESTHIPGVAKNMSSYIYTSYIQDVYVGESLKIVATFKVPAADLAAGKIITVEDSQLPDEELLELKTDAIQVLANTEEIAQIVDPEGFAAEQNKRLDADEETKATVKAEIDGYEWSFYVNSTSYKISFSGNSFTVKTAFGSNGGSYTIQNGYIFCTYDSNGYVVEIPYEITDGDVDLDLIAAFDVSAG